MGLKYVNNDACFPSITVVGQFMEAVLSGRYDTDNLAIMMTQTGGCCRASNYVSFIRRALDKAGLSHIPVISLNANGMEKNPGFRMSPGLIRDAARAVVYGDLLMRCLYRVRPYEQIPGSADALHDRWRMRCIDSLVNKKSQYIYSGVCRCMVDEFDRLPIRENLKKPRVGIVGEILVKYMPLANNHLVELLEKEGAEAVVPDLMDFMNYSLYNLDYKHEFREIIEEDIKDNYQIEAYYDNWGSRVYLFHSEWGTYYLFSKKANAQVENLQFDFDKIRELECEYIFSAVEITDAEDYGLTLEGSFESESSWWRIWVYKL